MSVKNTNPSKQQNGRETERDREGGIKRREISFKESSLHHLPLHHWGILTPAQVKHVLIYNTAEYVCVSDVVWSVLHHHMWICPGLGWESEPESGLNCCYSNSLQTRSTKWFLPRFKRRSAVQRPGPVRSSTVQVCVLCVEMFHSVKVTFINTLVMNLTALVPVFRSVRCFRVNTVTGSMPGILIIDDWCYESTAFTLISHGSFKMQRRKMDSLNVF